MSDYPFKAEYAKSNRAGCKGCKTNIGKDTLRMALMVQSPMFDGKIPNWFHFACFWKRGKVTDTNEIHGFDALRWDDQQKIKDRIGGGGGGKASGGGAAAAGAGDYSDFLMEYAKSGASTCRGCDEKIGKGEVRIAKKDYDSQKAKMYGPVPLWHHVDCFVDAREDLEFDTDMNPDKINGYKSIQKEDQEMIVEKLGKGSKKRKGAAGGGDAKAKKAKTTESAEDKSLREQSQLLWKIRDSLTRDVSNDALKGLLMYNDQEVPGGESKLLDRVSEGMVFGAFQPCDECKEGQFVYSGSGNSYRCTGNVTQWTKCQNQTQKPKKKPFKIPKEYHDVEFLKKFKFQARDRVFPKKATSFSEGAISSAATSGPLAGMKVAIVGKTDMNKTQLTQFITNLGGTVAPKVDKQVAFCISSKAEVEKNSKGIKDCKKADICVVEETILEEVKKGGAALLIQSKNLCSWGIDPTERVCDVSDGPLKSKSAYKSAISKKEEAYFTKSVPSTMKMKVKGGAGVDPESGLEDSAHVVQDGKDIYNAVLGLVDIISGTNSYYKLQALESDKGGRWWLFRAWGRVGTTIGGNKVELCGSKASVISKFLTLYGEKTGNDWSARDSFVKYPNRFYPLDIDYGDDDDNVTKLSADAGSKSKLPKAVQDLVKLIFDVESMKKAMLEFEIDLKKMPLGKLSKKQIESAYSILTELNQLVQNKATATTSKFLDASNRFYTLIPHDFGMQKPPMLDSEEIIKNKTEMLDNLLEIEIAYNMLKGGDDGTKDPLDVHYEKLKTDLKPMDKKSDEFEMLKKYVKNTHAKTHNQYDLEVEEIFIVARDGESKRFKPFKNLHNRQLLWHGSRITNYAGILSQGLRIAPPEAPVTGYMFGKGVYFADMVSKSANYCRTSRSDPTGVLLLCEVALGNMHELTHASFITKLPKGTHSTKGCGRTVPDPSMTITSDDGVVIPLGTGTDDTTYNHSSLLYNEYIVYDTAQINIKYMLKTKFKFKY